MRLLKADLSKFRNIDSAQLEFSPRFTALVGPNGQGKTNTLEALYFLAALRPLRPVPRRALFQSGTKQLKVGIDVSHQKTGLKHSLEVSLEGGGRVLTKDDKRCQTHNFLGMAVAVAFTPDDLQLAKGGPDARRRFLDRALLNLKASYLTRALRYQKAIKERNRLLVENAPDDTLSAFDQVLAQEGSGIVQERARYVSEVGPLIAKNFETIAQPAPELLVNYRCSLGDEVDLNSSDQILACFLDKLLTKRAYDRKRCSTSVGPHLDDLQFRLDGGFAKDRASQGQHRALVLALKLAEISHLTETLGEAPVLLLDDMSSELDNTRSGQLFEFVSHLSGQVVLTSTQEPKEFPPVLSEQSDLVVYDVSGGTLTRRDSL